MTYIKTNYEERRKRNKKATNPDHRVRVRVRIMMREGRGTRRQLIQIIEIDPDPYP